jgi:hypothetical protein
MTTAPTDEPSIPKSLWPQPLRVWPGVLAVVLQWLAWIVLPRLVPEAALYGILGGILGGGLAVIVWWLFFSRAHWIERVAALVLMPIALFATSRMVHASIRRCRTRSQHRRNGRLPPVPDRPLTGLASG